MITFESMFLLSQLSLLAHQPRGCMGLAPFLSHKSSIFDGINSQTNSRYHYNALGNNNASPSASSTQLSMTYSGGSSYSPEPERSQQAQSQKQVWTEYITPDLEVPTITQQALPQMAQMPPRPKVVVFGASGRIGRRILKKLLNSGVDMDVVAFVRNRKKLEKVLYDDEDLVLDNLINRNGSSKNSGPKLHIVESDVVSQRDVYTKNFETDDEEKVLDVWVNKAKSYFESTGWNDYNNSTSIKSFENDEKVAQDVDILESGGEEVLRDVISGSTILISCLASFRPSNVWTDYLKVPILRVFRKDAARWCSDPTHPYYVNYLSTQKILREAEKEQQKRNTFLEIDRERQLIEDKYQQSRGRGGIVKEEEGFESEIAARLAELRKKRSASSGIRSSNSGDVVRLPKSGQRPSSSDRIKFIRISHLMVGHSPFRVWSVITNVFWSQLSKFELMAEMLMNDAKLVDTIVLRPGDLTDDERNANNTSLQLCIDGRVDSPSVVGREDVADLAVVSALTKTSTNETSTKESSADTTAAPAHHYTWSMRWTGQYLSPPQGLRPDGLSSAALCFVKAIKEQTNFDTQKRMKENEMQSYHGGKALFRFKNWRRRLKPYTRSLAISIPLYSVLGVLSWYLFGQTFIDLFMRLKRLSMPQVILKLLP